ncbi:aminoacylase-1 [Holotrichia oblita]|uniref:Aminoacylase-1 n=1 Tax=Holotrichia oblita TaxID=644536 RepID=A0ACB9TVQ9_HOLOL|nr:aminoacylase-1 [Holotrichia oblita]
MSVTSNDFDEQEQEAIKNFRKYLMIPSVHPNINYDKCVEFLQEQADDIGLPCDMYTAVQGKPIVIITWLGTRPELPAVMLNSHMDVVPVYEDKWTHKPFDADMDDEGNIYARGSQDMKNVGIQYLEAIKRLKGLSVKLKRTIHVTFVPDEEIGGEDGMGKFVESDYFKKLNIGVAFDESMASSNDDFITFFGERSTWVFHIHCTGIVGHASNLVDNTAAQKLQFVINKLLNFRESERGKLKTDKNLIISDVTSINLTQIKGGIQANVIPPEFIATFDCRVPVTVDHNEWANTIEQWCKEAGEGVWVEYELKQPRVPVTLLNHSNPYWGALKTAAEELGIKLRTIICPGSTDAKYIRRVGLPAFGFSPMNNTPLLLHGHDEYLNVNVFLRGITIYCKIIETVGNIE